MVLNHTQNRPCIYKLIYQILLNLQLVNIYLNEDNNIYKYITHDNMS